MQVSKKPMPDNVHNREPGLIRRTLEGSSKERLKDSEFTVLKATSNDSDTVFGGQKLTFCSGNAESFLPDRIGASVIVIESQKFFPCRSSLWSKERRT